jgi:hypothetical protein
MFIRRARLDLGKAVHRVPRAQGAPIARGLALFPPSNEGTRAVLRTAGFVVTAIVGGLAVYAISARQRTALPPDVSELLQEGQYERALALLKAAKADPIHILDVQMWVADSQDSRGSLKKALWSWTDAAALASVIERTPSHAARLGPRAIFRKHAIVEQRLGELALPSAGATAAAAATAAGHFAAASRLYAEHLVRLGWLDARREPTGRWPTRGFSSGSAVDASRPPAAAEWSRDLSSTAAGMSAPDLLKLGLEVAAIHNALAVALHASRSGDAAAGGGGEAGAPVGAVSISWATLMCVATLLAARVETQARSTLPAGESAVVHADEGGAVAAALRDDLAAVHRAVSVAEALPPGTAAAADLRDALAAVYAALVGTVQSAVATDAMPQLPA